MSDYEVTLVNDNMREFYVRFYGPPESELQLPSIPGPTIILCSSVRRRNMEDTRRTTS